MEESLDDGGRSSCQGDPSPPSDIGWSPSLGEGGPRGGSSVSRNRERSFFDSILDEVKLTSKEGSSKM